KSVLRKAGADFYHQRQIQFSNDLQNIYKNACRALLLDLKQPQRKKEYYKVFNGASLKIPRGMRDGIAGLPYVKKVYKDGIKRTIIKDAVKIVGADSVWSKYQDQGDSIRIGVIDTGIDYMHPALGGGIGPAFKVMGGYDFVNNDNDPMDDYGHGTHVAGIIAADSDSIRGVAPHARLYSYKALDMYGRGYDSDIISAIEAVSDPDNDGSDSDKLDIVNMSLGDYAGNPYDAVTSAVNNAVRSGITFCIAAGNAGDYSTIGSPGTAELAITVGASDKRDNLAEFSSCGPVKKTFIMKPEILAPGDSILSTLPGGNYGKASGTSMASPVVAGLCALLKSRHKEWDPAMIKSAIVSSAKDLGLDAMRMGAGRIDVNKAIRSSTFSIPSQLNFSLDDVSQGTWIKKDTIEILNSSGIEINYNIIISGLPAGVSLLPEPATFSIKPGEKQKTIFTLAIDNNILPYSAGRNISYSGKIKISSSTDTLTVPWAFVKRPLLFITFTKPYLYYFIYNTNKLYDDSYAWNANDSMYSEVLLPEGKYTIVAAFSNLNNGVYENSMVFNSEFKVDISKTVRLGPEQATLSFKFEGVNESGNSLQQYPNVTNFVQFALPFSSHDDVFGFCLDNNHKLLTSIVPDEVKIFGGQFQIDTKNEKAVRALQFAELSGMKSSVIFKNRKDSFICQNINIDLSNDSLQAVDMACTNRMKSFQLDYYYEKEKILDPRWRGKIFLTTQVNDSYGYTINIACNDGKNILKKNWESEPFIVLNADTVSLLNGRYLSAKGSELFWGEGPFFYTWGLSSMFFVGDYEYFNIYSVGKLNEQRLFCDYNSTLILYDINNLIVHKSQLGSWEPMKVSPGDYRGEVSSDYYTVAGRRGNVKLKFDLTL
ncbi:MAG: S8 family serine peptidase, partial [Syntrophothermus sp.]